VDELDPRLLAEHARDVVLEADTEPDEGLTEQLALLLLLERAVELGVREQTLAQEQRAEVRARLVVEEGVVEACLPHAPCIGFLGAFLEDEPESAPRASRVQAWLRPSTGC